MVTGREMDHYGFRVAVSGACSFSLEVPEATTLSFRAALDDDSGVAPVSPVRVRVEASSGLAESQPFASALGPESTDIAGSIAVPSGQVTIRLVAERAQAAPGSARIAWTDLVLRTRDPAFAAELPWSSDPERALAPFFEAASLPRTVPDARRLLIVGIDGASWEGLRPLLEAGEMPALAALRARARWGALRSMVVPESAMSWTALRTGVGSGRNGVFTFLSGPTPRRSFWHQLGDHGLRSLIVGVPKADPTKALNGILVADWTRGPRASWSWPAELKPYLRRAGFVPSLARLRNVEIYQDRMRRRTEVALQLLAKVDWNLAFVVYEYTDTVAHRFGLFREEWDSVHRAVDRELAALLAAVGEETTVLVVSDHGWKQYARSLSIDAWLEQNGYSGWRTNLPYSGNTISISSVDDEQGDPPAHGREADGDSLRALATGLSDLVDPSTGERVVARIRESHRAFEGPFSDRAPGRLLVELRPEYRALPRKAEAVFPARPSQHHSAVGIYAIAGPEIAAGPSGERSLLDVAPTVLRYFGVAAPDDSEGEALDGVGRGGPLAPAGAKYFDGEAAPAEAPSPELEQGLRSLGYIE